MLKSLQTAQRRILAYFHAVGNCAYQRRDLERIFREQFEIWKLAPPTRAKDLIDFLLERNALRVVELSPTMPKYRSKTRYLCGKPSAFSVALSLAKGSYLTHGTAVFLHQLNDQIPSTIYVNREQSPKPSNPDSLSQEGIRRAFASPQRRSRYEFPYGDFRLTLLSGKHTDRLGVIPLPHSPQEELRITNIERTLIDITVRPDYAGGVYEVLAAYREAREQVSLHALLATLKKLEYVYPYHQAIGFYLERAGYPAERLQPFRKLGLRFDFFISHGVREPAFNESWRVFHPKGF